VHADELNFINGSQSSQRACVANADDANEKDEDNHDDDDDDDDVEYCDDCNISQHCNSNNCVNTQMGNNDSNNMQNYMHLELKLIPRQVQCSAVHVHKLMLGK
jgi:hypothetical protein